MSTPLVRLSSINGLIWWIWTRKHDGSIQWKHFLLPTLWHKYLLAISIQMFAQKHVNKPMVCVLNHFFPKNKLKKRNEVTTITWLSKSRKLTVISQLKYDYFLSEVDSIINALKYLFKIIRDEELNILSPYIHPLLCRFIVYMIAFLT